MLHYLSEVTHLEKALPQSYNRCSLCLQAALDRFAFMTCTTALGVLMALQPLALLKKHIQASFISRFAVGTVCMCLLASLQYDPSITSVPLTGFVSVLLPLQLSTRLQLLSPRITSHHALDSAIMSCAVLSHCTMSHDVLSSHYIMKSASHSFVRYNTLTHIAMGESWEKYNADAIVLLCPPAPP